MDITSTAIQQVAYYIGLRYLKMAKLRLGSDKVNMNIEEIKKRLAYLPRELKDGGFSDNSLTFCARLDIEYLLSIIEQAEKALELASKQIKDDDEDMAIEYGTWSENMEDSEVLKEVKSALKSIQGDE